MLVRFSYMDFDAGVVTVIDVPYEKQEGMKPARDVMITGNNETGKSYLIFSILDFRRCVIFGSFGSELLENNCRYTSRFLLEGVLVEYVICIHKGVVAGERLCVVNNDDRKDVLFELGTDQTGEIVSSKANNFPYYWRNFRDGEAWKRSTFLSYIAGELAKLAKIEGETTSKEEKVVLNLYDALSNNLIFAYNKYMVLDILKVVEKDNDTRSRFIEAMESLDYNVDFLKSDSFRATVSEGTILISSVYGDKKDTVNMFLSEYSLKVFFLVYSLLCDNDSKKVIFVSNIEDDLYFPTVRRILNIFRNRNPNERPQLIFSTRNPNGMEGLFNENEVWVTVHNGGLLKSEWPEDKKIVPFLELRDGPRFSCDFKGGFI